MEARRVACLSKQNMTGSSKQCLVSLVAGPVNGSRSHRFHWFRVGWHGWLFALQYRLSSPSPSPHKRRHRWRCWQYRRDDSHIAPSLGNGHRLPATIFPTTIPTSTSQSPPSPSDITRRGPESPPAGLPQLGDSCHRPILTDAQLSAPDGASGRRGASLQPTYSSGGVGGTEDDGDPRCPPQGHRRSSRGKCIPVNTSMNTVLWSDSLRQESVQF
jgi:hypothetical protein